MGEELSVAELASQVAGPKAKPLSVLDIRAADPREPQRQPNREQTSLLAWSSFEQLRGTSEQVARIFEGQNVHRAFCRSERGVRSLSHGHGADGVHEVMCALGERKTSDRACERSARRRVKRRSTLRGKVGVQALAQ